MSEVGLVRYDSLQGEVELSLDSVKKYLARGNQPLTDSEAMLFIKLCQYQKLNPFTNEAYAIKFNGQFTMVTGYDTFKRRAESNSSYYGRKSGITVMRGKDIIQKEGTCLYPTETLLGGWCKVFRRRGPSEIEEVFREVSMAEYSKGQSTWKTMPATMINKVAVSQALRDAFPIEFEGMYTDAELAPVPIEEVTPINCTGDESVTIDVITKEQRQELFAKAHELFGDQEGNAKIKQLLSENGLDSTTYLSEAVFETIMERLDIMAENVPVTEEQAAFPPNSIGGRTPLETLPLEAAVQ